MTYPSCSRPRARCNPALLWCDGIVLGFVCWCNWLRFLAHTDQVRDQEP
jgi:hypothetical protein